MLETIVSSFPSAPICVKEASGTRNLVLIETSSIISIGEFPNIWETLIESKDASPAAICWLNETSFIKDMMFPFSAPMLSSETSGTFKNVFIVVVSKVPDDDCKVPKDASPVTSSMADGVFVPIPTLVLSPGLSVFLGYKNPVVSSYIHSLNKLPSYQTE